MRDSSYLKRDMLMLAAGLVLLAFLFFFLFYNPRNRLGGTVWIEKESGWGPWKIKSANRSQEEGVSGRGEEASPESLNPKDKPSSHRVQFGTDSGVLGGKPAPKKENIPEVKY